MGRRNVVVDVDGVSINVPRKETRKTRNGGIRQETKEKFLNQSQNRERLVPMNDKQAEYINAIQTQPVIICIGVWGSSKTYIPSVIAADWLMDKKIDKLIIARPNEGKGKSIGFLKGDKNEKLQSWTAPITDTIKQRLGVSTYEAMLSSGKIELLNLEAVKGRSWDNCMVLCDEMEDVDIEVAKSLVGRQGVNTTTVLTGDSRQQDLKSKSGLQYLIDVAEYCNLPITIIDFDSWDYCVRSEEAKMWGRAIEKFENRGCK